MSEPKQEETIIKISEILNDLGIKHFITGGLAVVAWGRPRFTADVDVVIEIEEAGIKKLVAKLSKINEFVYIEEAAAMEALKTSGEFNFIDPISGFKFDFFISKKNDLLAQSQMSRRVRKDFLNSNMYFASPEDLIVSKLIWYQKTKSNRHLEDVESIIKIQKKLDWEYIIKWSKIEGLDHILSKFTK